MARASRNTEKEIDSLKHREARRKNIPTAELETLVSEAEQAPKTIRYKRNTDLDPQLVWRGKDEQDTEDLMVDSVPIYIQEKIQPEAIIRDLLRRSEAVRRERAENEQYAIPDIYQDFNGFSEPGTEFVFYQHDKNWSNRMILGDSLLVMTSLAEKEALKGQVQCIYMDPPYGIKFNSNWQPSTKSRDVKDGQADSLSREPEMIRAFRDTWRDGIHSYLAYLRDRLTVARDLLAESGAIFVQIGQENCHLVRGLLDEILGAENFISQIIFSKTAGATSEYLSGTYDMLLLYAKSRDRLKYHQPFNLKKIGGTGGSAYTRVRLDDLMDRPLTEDELSGRNQLPAASRVFRIDNLTSQSVGRDKGEGAASWFPVQFHGRTFRPSEKVRWKTNQNGMDRLKKSARLSRTASGLYYVRYFEDFLAFQEDNVWSDTGIAGFASEKRYVVETSEKVIQRCILMATDPGDLVLDSTCGSGTTAYVAEQWGRRWITIDTSRVALALARQRVMAGRYPSHFLQDSPEGARKEGDLTGRPPKNGPFGYSLRQGFVYERVHHITLKSITSNAEIDVIWDTWQALLGSLLDRLNEALDEAWEEWEVPREAGENWPANAREPHKRWWEARRARQKEIDVSIARNADIEYLVDRPYEDKSKVRVAGSFTVESLSPHRVLSAEEDDALWAEAIEAEDGRPLPPRTRSARREEARRAEDDFVRIVLDNLLKAGVQNTKKGEKLEFTELKPWPGGRLINAEGRYDEGGGTRRVAVTIGPEYGTVSYGLVREAAREALDSVFDTLIICGFAFEPKVNEEALTRFPRLTVLKARMNNDLHLADSLRSQTNNANLFVIFGEPDITIHHDEDGRVRVEILGLDIFDPTTGEVRSSSLDDIAAWFIDTDYDGESFFVRHAYFLGGNDPYKRLKTTLKAEIDEEAWATLYSAVSRPFEKPETGRIAVKVINHYGDEVLKVYAVV
jgi:adenine-specific DNA-methyltransferase